VARIPGMSDACTKVMLSSQLNRASKLFPELFNFWPETWILPTDSAQLCEVMEKAGGSEYFIVKPDKGAQGDGIFMCRTWRDVQSKLRGNAEHVVQRYIPQPLLLGGVKFDLRLYALVTSVRPLRVYMCDEGLVRCCTQAYKPPEPSNLHQVTAHLTNYSLNKHSQDFVHSQDASGEDSSKRALSATWGQLAAQGVDVELANQRVDDLVKATCMALQPWLLQASKEAAPAGTQVTSQCFQVLGFDVLFDSELRPWLLEVNNSPSLCIDAVYTPEQFAERRPGVAVAPPPSAPAGPLAMRTRVSALDGESKQAKLCRCMDSHEPHFHEASPVDVAVKTRVVGGAVRLVLRERKTGDWAACDTTTYRHVPCDILRFEGLPEDALSTVVDLFSDVVGVRQK